MNRKFVKENKQVLREFIGKLLVNLITKKNKRALDKHIASDPDLKQHSDKMEKLQKDMTDRLKKIEKTNPKLADLLRQTVR
jgi:hypothetical protein|tara:strand:- start:827 stop:1069 length:243 start_codon:yes stop_codon:yes gene_type:complete